MDKGFYSTGNINAMLDDPSQIRYTFTAGFARKQLESERKDMDRLNNAIVSGGDSIRGVTKLSWWNTYLQLYTFVYYNAMRT